jgi:hypothetical protein
MRWRNFVKRFDRDPGEIRGKPDMQTRRSTFARAQLRRPDQISNALPNQKALIMTDNSGNVWGALGAGGFGALIGVVGTILTAMINRQPPMAAMIDARMRTLIEGYERRICDLQREVTKLQGRIDALTRALDDARMHRGLGP